MSSIPNDFQSKYTLDQRKQESQRILEKYPDKIPIICQKYDKDKSDYKLPKNKFLAAQDMTMGQFAFIIRKNIKMKQSEALFMFVGNVLILNTLTLQEVYQKNKNEDGFLYIHFSLENTFGSE